MASACGGGLSEAIRGPEVVSRATPSYQEREGLVTSVQFFGMAHFNSGFYIIQSYTSCHDILPHNYAPGTLYIQSHTLTSCTRLQPNFTCFARNNQLIKKAACLLGTVLT